MTEAPFAQGRIKFLALRSEIEAELQAGASIQDVYARLKDQLGISYPNFSRYVRRLIGQVPASKPRRIAIQPSPAPPVKDQQDAPREQFRAPIPPREQSRVVFNKSPTAEYLRDRLKRAEPQKDD